MHPPTSQVAAPFDLQKGTRAWYKLAQARRLESLILLPFAADHGRLRPVRQRGCELSLRGSLPRVMVDRQQAGRRRPGCALRLCAGRADVTRDVHAPILAIPKPPPPGNRSQAGEGLFVSSISFVSFISFTLLDEVAAAAPKWSPAKQQNQIRSSKGIPFDSFSNHDALEFPRIGGGQRP